MKELDNGKVTIVGYRVDSDCLIIWSKESNQCEGIKIPFVKEEMWNPFYAPLGIEDKLILMSRSVEHIYCVNLVSKKAEILKKLITVSK